jgi:NTE family protein
MAATDEKRPTALILAGAVAKGAFEAGVLSVLAEYRERLGISRVVGASAGALNAAIYAAAIRAGREQDAAARLAELWRESANWHDVFRWSLGDMVRLRGAGKHGRVLELMNEIVKDFYAEARRPVDLRIVLTDLAGRTGNIGTDPATTFENTQQFANEQFDTPEGWQDIAKTALGSAALPFLFAPVEVPHVGWCLDGGLVNNTPIKYAIEGGCDRIIVVSAQPACTAPASFEGIDLAGEVIEILINERLYRDLHQAASINEQIAKLDALVTTGENLAGNRRPNQGAPRLAAPHRDSDPAQRGAAGQRHFRFFRSGVP